MAVCSICGKKIGPLSGQSDVPYELGSFKICNTCDEKIFALKNFSSGDNQNIALYNSAKQYLVSYIDKCELHVGNYLRKLIVQYDTNISNDGKLNEIEKEVIKKQEDEYNQFNAIKLTNGFEFQGYFITDYIDIVSAESVIGTGSLSSTNASIADFMGVESSRYMSKLDEAKKAAIFRLRMKAYELGANAIIGLDFDYIVFSKDIIGIISNGTAVKIKKID